MSHTQAVLELAPYPEDRTLAIIRHARSVLRYGGPAKVRHVAAYGSFSLPDRPITDEAWLQRDCDFERSEWLRSHFLQERVLLEQHAREAGCDLIIHPNLQPSDKRPVGALLVRIEALLEFIQAMPADKLHVVVSESDMPGNLIIVGDWFSADSVTPTVGRGFLHTVFNRHAPSVHARVAEFDDTFKTMHQSFLDAHPGCSCREAAIVELERRRAELRSKVASLQI